MARTALLSVSDKTNLVDFAKLLKDLDFEIVSTGGTKKVLEAGGVDVTGVEEVTGFPEMLDGRVKTLHPKIHAGLLAKRDDPDHMKQLKDAGITPIDLVAVNLYPFRQTIEKPETTEAQAIEQIDIGGPSMLRAAAKNFADVLTIVDPNDYQPVIDALKAHSDDNAFRKHLAAKVFRHTAAYDAIISNYLTEEEFPDQLTLTYEKQQSLRYGENSHQKAAFYRDPIPSKLSMITKQLHGKELSFNNIKDANAALNMVSEFDDPCVVAMKHMNPCGVGTADNISQAWDEAYESDPMSIFGGIIAVNREIDAQTAEKMHKIFLEIIIAPSFTDEAFEILAKKKNIRLLQADLSHRDQPDRFETISVSGGMLIQESDHQIDQIPDFKVVTNAQPTEQQLKALQFGQHIVKFVKSNAVVVTTDTKTLGVGMGQPNRIDSAKIAIQKAMPKDGYEHAIMASDAFFPMDDCVEYAAQHDIKAIIQPGGSIRDKDSIAMADKYGIAMVTTGVRHFRH
ncbi:bifunctional phosphoribosylaminoimidazolecarboxamide formyltransferase/IMP cyclohydrolase [Lentilactobacillus hilgardii]|uniref:Bifunctional purine biosynthesis protein PurH n=1 Tax=Lentilactobacillus hilgardii (strain ATCC 8290 / DSM 20176 / CCUG 30140 / JCM 1155 / KCTC 3500 / NBRC 15886 / NCIMB 8040 / NRRL B-1843 / 9) TaxID=1423757 RepID=C0XJI8_LENH9|nr:bifunctional phosphoribosylaminoimidazolecarboxamide formyltransferase/IMP cyclohydrolase [Lentilactobacillus hilgardii]EEI24460.1 phosphoribosylaminoimidazolecarboxamide formyltransferase/IMP cyclohydrolase [Lentilactobacillus hilgardii DSM 20176 = ATCC 8290]KRK54050.1 bifunctional phosphoribosylaminoimidazolecarboxamide formyltransferase IMP cyclohydrolase [Lentilactobacillus hilgardii DSM 20176 = ATCC 8290]QEU37758.1 bifunctional phosphoribosylaminoimidazolecarboxamide formyltransferase/IM